MAVKVFVVDDSAVVRQALAHMLSGVADIELIGSAPNPLLAIEMMRKNPPDVLLLDIEMPGMDGLTFLRQIMSSNPIPTVICSTLSTEGSRVALDALSAGAVAVLAKPKLGLKQHLDDSRHEMIQTLKTAARARPRPKSASFGIAARAANTGAKDHNASQSRTPVLGGVHAFAMNKPVLIGSSTGGTQALELILTSLPADAPGIAITQHMPEKFTAMYAQRVDGVCAMNVREAKDGDRLERGVALIAPGGRHMQLTKSNGQYYVKVVDGPPVNRHKPSVDVLFKSAAECAGRDALAMILTGMGDDGARGMKLMHNVGARTIAQNEETCVVFGMPKEAIKLQAVDDILPLEGMARAILQFDSRA
ncbi:MAG: chemotaxis response regulator protein-glutamate methylesterase [Rhodoferax sp.]|nr:chemotaxis response regulator protein-glutamate methylesterase [Rhodoferax sp.]